MKLFTVANCLSMSRIVLAPLTLWSLVDGYATCTVILYCFVIVSDLVDGRIARRLHQVTPFGTLLDHGADAVFVIMLCAGGAWLSHLPVALPVLITLAFLQYAVDSRTLSRGVLRGSHLGRWNGIGYFVIVGMLIVVHQCADNTFLDRVVYSLGGLLIVTTVASMVERGWHTLREARRL